MSKESMRTMSHQIETTNKAIKISEKKFGTLKKV